MNAILLILIVISIIMNLASIYIIFKYERLTDRTLDLNTRLVDKREKIAKILYLAEVTKENFFVTIEKLKKELDMPSKRI